MKQHRWMSMEEVFDQLEEAETQHMLQLWEREEREEREAGPHGGPAPRLAAAAPRPPRGRGAR